MTNNLGIKDSTNTTKFIHTIEDSTSAHYNQSIPTDAQGNTAVVVSNGQAARTTDGALVIALSPNSPTPSGTNLLGGVSIRQIVSVVPDGTGANFPVSVASLPVTPAGTNLIGAVSIRQIVSVVFDGTNANVPVSIAGTLVVGTHAVTQSGVWNVNAALTSTNNNIALTSIGTSPVAVGTGAAATALRVAFSPNVDKTLLGMVSIGDSNVPVTQSGVWNVNAALTSTNNNVALTSIATNPVAIGTGAAATALRIAMSPNTDKTLIGMVSLGDGVLANSGGTLAVQSLLIGAEVSTALSSFAAKVQAPLQADTSGRLRVAAIPANTDKTVIGAVSIADSNVVIGTGANAIGKLIAAGDKVVIGAVSLADGILALPNGTLAANSILIGAEVSTASQTYSASKQGNLQLDTSGRLKTWPLPSNADKTVIGAVSIAGINPVSIAGVVTVTPFTNTGAAVPTAAFYIGGSDGTNVQAMKVDSTGTQKVGGYMSTPFYSFTRPADTTAYTINDLVANSTTLGSVTPLSWPVSRFAAGTAQNISIRRARIRCSKTTTHRGHNFRLHLWNKGSNSVASNANVSTANADNGAFSATKSSYYVGAIDVSCDYLFTDGSAGAGSANKGTEINIVTSGTGQVSISGYLEVLTSLSPANGETFVVTLEVFQD